MSKSWEIKSLGEICEMYQPKTISTKEMVDDGEYPVFGANGIIGKYDKYNHEETQLLITCRGATCGSVNISEPKSWINGNAMVIRPKDHSIHLKFLEYLFRGGIDLSKTITGAAQPQITRQTLFPVLITFPKSLPEQQRIVAILDEAFAKIEKAKANAEQNLKNAKELFESYLQGVFENKGEDWEEKTLGEVASFRNGLNFAKNAKGEQIKIVGVRDFQNSFWVPTETLSNVNLDNKLHDFDTLRDGDIITVRSNGNPQLIGRTLLARNISEKISHSGFTIRIRLNDHRIDPEYLCNYVKTTKTRKILVDGGNGVSIKSLNQGSLSELVITYPNKITEQQNIVKHLNKISQQINKLEAIYEQKINDLEELKKSVLQKAFSGEL
jgi:type I restriction enzyme S subunit